MDKLKNMTDAELTRTLQKYGIAHGPVVGTTRTIYEKKLLRYEREKTKFPTTKGPYESQQQYSRRDYDDDNGDNHTYEEEEYTKTYHYPQAYQRTKDDLQDKYRAYRPNENTYQNIYQSSYQPSYAQGVEPRKPIRPKQKEEETSVKRYIPLWFQLLLLFLISAFLVYMYILQSDDNPFKLLPDNL